MGGVQEPLTSIASAVRGYAGALEAAQRQVAAANQAGQAAAAAAPREQAAYAPALSAARQDAAQALSAVEEAARNAAATINAAADDLHHLFAADGPVNAWLKRAAAWNDDAGWGLNAWGTYGEYVLGKAEFNTIVKTAERGTAWDSYSEAIDGVMNRSGGFFGPDGLYARQSALNAAQDARAVASDRLAEAIAPTEGFMGRVVGRAGLGLGMVSDLITEAKPSPSFGPDGLLGGTTDRVMAGLNVGASGLALGSSLGIDATPAPPARCCSRWPSCRCCTSC